MRLRPYSTGGCTFFMRTIVFIDGQNLYHMAKTAWIGTTAAATNPYGWPSYDVEKLAAVLVSRDPGRVLSETQFYTGVPDRTHIPSQNFWHDFWAKKLRHLGNQGIYTYRGRVNSGGQEKGVDVSLALDLVRATYEQRYEVAIIVSQDSDFGPAVSLAREIAQSQNRPLLFESAFPFNPGMNPRGVSPELPGFISTRLFMMPVLTPGITAPKGISRLFLTALPNRHSRVSGNPERYCPMMPHPRQATAGFPLAREGRFL